MHSKWSYNAQIQFGLGGFDPLGSPAGLLPPGDFPNFFCTGHFHKNLEQSLMSRVDQKPLASEDGMSSLIR